MNAITQLNASWRRVFPGPNATKVGPIGIDCAMSAVHLMQLEHRQDGEIAIRASASQAFAGTRDELLSDRKKFNKVMQAALKSAPFKGRQVVSVLPSPGADIFPVHYHVNHGESTEVALFSVLTERLNEDLSDLVVDYVPVRSAEGEEQTALVAVARREVVVDYLEALRLCGLSVECLEIGPVAIRRFVRTIGRLDRVENVMTVNFGRHASFITVISGRRLLMDQQVAFGEQDLIDEISNALDMPAEQVPRFVRQLQLQESATRTENEDYLRDAAATLKEILTPCFLRLVEEINRVLIYTASQTRGESVNKIYLLGSLARWQGVDQFLNDLVRVDVETIPNPLAAFNVDHIADSWHSLPAPELAVATGLSLSGMLPDEDF